MSFFEFPHTRTYDSDLGWLIKTVSDYDSVIENLNKWIEEYTPKIEEIEEVINTLMSGELPDGVKQAIYQWCQINLPDLVGEAIVSVAFELTDDGFFVAYYNDSWTQITFNTSGWDIILANVPDYGHLILTY